MKLSNETKVWLAPIAYVAPILLIQVVIPTMLLVDLAAKAHLNYIATALFCTIILPITSIPLGLWGIRKSNAYALKHKPKDEPSRTDKTKSRPNQKNLEQSLKKHQL